MEKFRSILILFVLLLAGLVSCSPSNNMVATYLFNTKSVWTIQPTYTFFPIYTTPIIVTREITKYIVPTETLTITMTATDIGKNVWSTFGPPGAENMTIDALAIDPKTPTTIYALGDPKGLFKSLDGGLTWSEINSNLEFDLFNSILIDPLEPEIIYVSSFYGLYKSTNGAGYWQLISGHAEAGGRIGFLTFDPNMPTTLFGGGDIGIYKSTDGGYKWYGKNSGIPFGLSINSIVIDQMIPTTLFAGGNFYGHVSSGSILKSTDGGENWSVIKSNLLFDEFISMAIDIHNPLTVYAGMWGGALKSTDGGENWKQINVGLHNTYIMDLVMDPSNANILYLGTQGDGVYKTIDGGKKWFTINNGFPSGERVFSLAIDPLTPTIIYAGTDEGVFVIHQS